MAARVQEWLRAHPPTDRNQVAIVQRFEALLAKTQALSIEEQSQQLANQEVVRSRMALRRSIERQLRSVTRIGAFATRSDARAAMRFAPIATKSGKADFLAAASNVLEAVRQHQEALVSHGLTNAQLNAFASGLERFREAIAEEQTSRQQYAAAREALLGAVGELTELVGLLDAFHRERFDGDARMLAQWRAWSAVNRPAPRSKSGEAVDDAAPPPAPAAAPPPAAPAPPAAAAGPADAGPDDQQDRAA